MTVCKKLKIKIPENVCTIPFGNDKQVRTQEFRTCRNELMLLHFDVNDHVVEIELISNKKPCQRSTKKTLGKYENNRKIKNNR
jgi:hypothetical protein